MGLLNFGMRKAHPATHAVHRAARAIWEGNLRQIAYEHERDTVHTMSHGGGVKYSVAKKIVRQARSQKRPH